MMSKGSSKINLSSKKTIKWGQINGVLKGLPVQVGNIHVVWGLKTVKVRSNKEIKYLVIRYFQTEEEELYIYCDEAINSSIKANIIHFERPYHAELLSIYRDGRVKRNYVVSFFTEVGTN